MTTRSRTAILGLLALSLLLAACQSSPEQSPTPGPGTATATLPISTAAPGPTATEFPVRTVTPGLPQSPTPPVQPTVASPTAPPPPTAAPSSTPAAPTEPAGAGTGMVILEFADAKDGAYTVAFQAMRERGVPGLAYVNVEPVEQRKAGHLTPEQLDDMNAAGWDIASHGYSHDDPTQMTSDQLTQHLEGAQQWLLQRGYTLGARHYGPPSNNCNQAILDAALKVYDTVWCREFSKLPAGYDFGTGACGNNTPWERLQSAFDRLEGKPNRVLRCSFHDLVPQNPTGNQADLERIEAILDYLEAKKIPVVTLSDLLDGTVPK